MRPLIGFTRPPLPPPLASLLNSAAVPYNQLGNSNETIFNDFDATADGANKKLIVVCAMEDSGIEHEIVHLEFNGDALTKDIDFDDGSSPAVNVQIWYLDKPDAVTADIAGRTNGNINDLVFFAFLVSNLAAGPANEDIAYSSLVNSSMPASLSVDQDTDYGFVISMFYADEELVTIGANDASMTEESNGQQTSDDTTALACYTILSNDAPKTITHAWTLDQSVLHAGVMAYYEPA